MCRDVRLTQGVTCVVGALGVDWLGCTDLGFHPYVTAVSISFSMVFSSRLSVTK